MQCELAILSATIGLPGYGSAALALARERGVDPVRRELDRAQYTVTWARRLEEDTSSDDLAEVIADLYKGEHFEYARRKWMLLNTVGQGDSLRKQLRHLGCGGISLVEIVEGRTGPPGDDLKVAKLEMSAVLRRVFERGQLKVHPEVDAEVGLAQAVKSMSVRTTRAKMALSDVEDAAEAVADPLGEALLSAVYFAEVRRPLPRSSAGATVEENNYDPLARENL